MNSNQKIIELRNVSCRRQGTHILEDINWVISKSENWALIGANGSGKTTLLKIITGYEWPTEGTVIVEGRRFGECSLPELRKTIGWVSSALNNRVPNRDTALEVAASGLDASIGLYREHSPNELERAIMALRDVSVEYAANRQWGVLSQGERQRVLIARSMVCKPRVLILDEPCAGLDPVARQHFLADLDSLDDRSDAPAIILVTHHIEEIGHCINKVLALKGGRTLAGGAKPEVITPSVISDVFDNPCTIEKITGYYHLLPTS